MYIIVAFDNFNAFKLLKHFLCSFVEDRVSKPHEKLTVAKIHDGDFSA